MVAEKITENPKYKGYAVKPLDICIVCLMLLRLFVLNYLGFGKVLKLVILAFLSVRCLLCFKQQKMSKLAILLLLALGVFLLLNIAQGVACEILLSNALALGYPLLCLAYLVLLKRSYPQTLRGVAMKSCIPLNVVFLLNLIVMYVQINLHTWVAVNSSDYTAATGEGYWWDVSSGLFMFCGTHVVCLFTAFMLIYNLWLINKTKGLKRYLLIAWLCVAMVASLNIALLNDNKGMLLLLPLVFSLYLFSEIRWLAKRKTHVSVLLILGFVSAAFCLVPVLVRLEAVYSIIFNLSFSGITIGFDAYGSSERIAIVCAALELFPTWLFGLGFGNYFFRQSGVLGFEHFGQSDLGPLLVLGGVWITLMALLLYMMLFCHLINEKNGRVDSWKLVGILIIFLFSLVYTQLLTEGDEVLCFSFLVLSFSYLWESQDESLLTQERRHDDAPDTRIVDN